MDAPNHRVLLFDPALLTSDRYPVDGVVVELTYYVEVPGKTQPDGASAASIGGYNGWQIVKKYATSAPGQVTLSHGLQVTRGGYTYNLVGFFAQKNPDDSVFNQIASTFRFAK